MEEEEWRSMGAVLLERGLSYDDIVPCKAVVHESTSVDGGALHRVTLARDPPLVMRIVCTRGDAAGMALVVGERLAHLGLATPFDAVIPLLALQYHTVCLESREPFEVCVTYGSLLWDTTHVTWGSLFWDTTHLSYAALRDARMIVWQYADGTAFCARWGMGEVRGLPDGRARGEARRA